MSNYNLERKLRHDLAKLGYRLCKSHARNWSYDNQLGYMIVENEYNITVQGSRYDLTLEDVRDFLAE